MGLYEEPDISKEELEQAVEELRSRFLEEVKERKGIQEDYCEADIDKIRQDDWYCQRFILHEKGDVDKALEMARVALKWRKDFCVHDIKESSLLVEFFEAGGVFPYNKDRLDNENLMILVKLNKKDSDIQLELRRFLIYWIEKLDKQSNGKKMNVIFNCSSAGLGNLDLDMIRFIINAFKYYYPWLLESILVYDMPWLFGAAWKLIKSWLPQDDVKRVRFVNKKNILELIDANSLPISMGGTDTFEYVYVPTDAA